MLAQKLTILLAAAGQASAAFNIGLPEANSYVETEPTSRRLDNSASQGKLVVATRTLGDLTYTYLSADFAAESATDTIAEAMPQSTSSSQTTSIVTETATETRHSTRTTTITRTLMINTTSPAATQTHPLGDLPFQIHGGGDHTSITFYGYGTTTPSTTHSTFTTVVPYAHSIVTSQPEISTLATTTASTQPTTVTVSPGTPAASTTVPASSSTTDAATHSTTASPNDTMPSTAVSSPPETTPATTLSGLTIPGQGATATESPKEAPTHDLSAGSRDKLGLTTLLLAVAVAVVFVFQ